MKDALGFVFPGQGSQKAGMLSELGEAFPIIGETFAEASAALDYDLWELVQHGDDSELSRTHITQPAILTASVAVWRLWRQQGGAQPALMAGHSLGEYSALVAAEVLDFSDAVRLVRQRGELMQSAVPEGEGGMAAIVGLDDDKVERACAEAARDQVVAAVNYNSPGQVVIAGHRDALGRAVTLCKEAGAKRALPLPVSAPFHSALMEPAARRFAELIAAVPLRSPAVPVLQNHGLESPRDPTVIRDNLVRQIYSPVPWVATIRRFAEAGIGQVLEIGPGKVLCGLIKRIDGALECQAVNDPSGLQAALALNHANAD